MRSKVNKLAWLVVCGGLALACNKTSESAPSATAQNPVNDEAAQHMTAASGTHSATEQIAAARCQREQACGNIGNDKSYASSAACLSKVREDWRDELNARECPGGVNAHELDECLTEIKGEACANPFDTLARMTECTQGQICLD
jgi:hypothetical protein